MAIGVDLHPFYQRGINWAGVSGVNYVWVKVSDGGSAYTKVVNGVTYYPATHVNGAKSRGIPVGGYHFAEPGDPVAQADILIREIERLGATGLNPALDLEGPFPIGQARAFGEAFCNRIRARGYTPVLYTGDAYAATIRPDLWASKPVLWIARYGAKPKNVRYDVHQYSSSGPSDGVSLPGVAQAVDQNESYNDKLFNTGEDVAITDADAAVIANKIFWGTVFDTNGNANYAGYLKGKVDNLNAQVVQANTAIAGLSQAVARLSSDPNITVEQLTAIVNSAIAEHVNITGTVQITSEPAPTS